MIERIKERARLIRPLLLPLAFKIAALFGKLIEEVFEPDESDAR